MTYYNIRTGKHDASLPRAVQYALFLVQGCYVEESFHITQLKREQGAVTIQIDGETLLEGWRTRLAVITPEEYDEALTWQHRGNHHIFS